MPYVRSLAKDPSPVSFSNDRGPGAFAPLHALPRRTNHRRTLFHLDHDDDHDPSPPPSPPLHTPSDLPAQEPRLAVPFPRSSSSPIISPDTSPNTDPAAPTKITRSSSNIVLSNGRPLKSSLKSASSSSIADDLASHDDLTLHDEPRPHHAHARAQSMPTTPPAYKNVHFKEKDEGLESVRLFRRTGKPQAVSKNPADDTETETEPEHSYPFPRMTLPPLTEIASASPVPSEHPPPHANIHLESISLPPARPPVLRGTVLVRNLAFEKHVGVRFTLDDWTTVSEVLATYAGSVAARETLAGSAALTVGDLVGPAHTWDRFSFAIRLEDYEARLAARTLFLVARFTAPGAGEWWDNNSGANYRVAFRARPPAPAQPPARQTTAPFMLSAAAAAPARHADHEDPRATFAPRRAASTPAALGMRLNLRHYAAPAPVPVPPPAYVPTVGARLTVTRDGAGMGGRIVVGGQPATFMKAEEGREVDEGFGTGSDEDDAGVGEGKGPRVSRRRPQLSVTVSPPTPTSPRPQAQPEPEPAPAPRASMFSPTSVSPALPPAGLPDPAGDAKYAALLREWCFAHGEGLPAAVDGPPVTPLGVGVGEWGGGPMGSVG